MTTQSDPIRLATRSSDLARRQARSVSAALEDRRHAVELVEIETTGDQVRDELIHRLGTTGAFVRTLDEQVLDGAVDGAVHSMKDMPTDQPDELIVAAVPERAEPGDLLVTPGGATLAELPANATVGTSSLRRRAQLLAERPDLTVEPLRGNVDTRLEKLLAPHLQREHERRLEAERTGDDDGDAGDEDPTGVARSPEEWFDDLPELHKRALARDVETEYDAIVLAAAGLDRAGLEPVVETEPLSTDEFVPATGQGALAVTMLDTDHARTVHDALDHPRSRVETTVERTILSTLGGGCIAPIGTHAVIRGEHVHTTVQVLGQDGEDVLGVSQDLPVERHAETARELAADLADRGARDLVDAARADTGPKRGEASE